MQENGNGQWHCIQGWAYSMFYHIHQTCSRKTHERLPAWKENNGAGLAIQQPPNNAEQVQLIAKK